jgi:hypothetical protein
LDSWSCVFTLYSFIVSFGNFLFSCHD